jgi:hypothetical protein
VDPVDATDSDSRHPPCAVWCQRVLEWVVREGAGRVQWRGHVVSGLKFVGPSRGLMCARAPGAAAGMVTIRSSDGARIGCGRVAGWGSRTV